MERIIQDEGQFKVDAKQLSLKQLAEKYGMQECTVSKWKKKLDVLTVPKNIELPDKEEFMKDVEQYPNTELAKKYGVGLRLISKWRKKLGASNVWNKEMVNWEQFNKDSKVLRWNEMTEKYHASWSSIKLWKQQRGLTTGKKENREITWVEDKKGCWVCTSHKLNNKGYAQCKGDQLVARRLWSKTNGVPWPGDLVCCHSCDNTWCVNPNHVNPGTMKENQEGMAERDRSPWGWRSGARKLTKDQAIEIFKLRDSGRSQNDVGKEYSVSGGTVWHIWNGKTWWRDVFGLDNFNHMLTKPEVREGDIQ